MLSTANQYSCSLLLINIHAPYCSSIFMLSTAHQYSCSLLLIHADWCHGHCYIGGICYTGDIVMLVTLLHWWHCYIGDGLQFVEVCWCDCCAGVGLYEGDEGLSMATALDGAGSWLCLPVQPGSSATSHNRLRLHQQDSHRLWDQTTAPNPCQGKRRVCCWLAVVDRWSGRQQGLRFSWWVLLGGWMHLVVESLWLYYRFSGSDDVIESFICLLLLLHWMLVC